MATIAEAMTQALQHYNAGDLPQAEALCRQVLNVDSFHSEAMNLLGVIALRVAKFDVAELWMRRATAMNPGQTAFQSNLGMALIPQGKLDEAVALYRHLLTLAPDSPQVLNNLGNALREQGSIEESLACFERAVQLDPTFPEARLNRARDLLLLGRFGPGWEALESRWEQAETEKRTFPEPLWDGSPLEGRTILLYSEGGMGDTIQFVRYTSLVKQLGGRVILECQPRLLPLLANTPGIDQAVAEKTPLPERDVQVPLLSLPRILKTTLETIPRQVPYVTPDPALVAQWREKLGGQAGLKIGIAWQGNPHHERNLGRSIPVSEFAAVAKLPGVRLFSLQKGSGSEQLPQLAERFAVTDLGPQLDLGPGAFMDTAAVMKNLDLVITSDTSIPHLAGALGVPTWLLLRTVPEWRWLLHREDSPWYPTMRLFRQKTLGNWSEVFERVARELTRLS